MATRTLEISLDDQLLTSLQERVARGEASSMNKLIELDLEYAADLHMHRNEDDARAAEALREMETGEDPGVPIEEIMTRYGIAIPAGKQKAAQAIRFSSAAKLTVVWMNFTVTSLRRAPIRLR